MCVISPTSQIMYSFTRLVQLQTKFVYGKIKTSQEKKRLNHRSCFFLRRFIILLFCPNGFVQSCCLQDKTTVLRQLELHRILIVIPTPKEILSYPASLRTSDWTNNSGACADSDKHTFTYLLSHSKT